MSRTCRIAFATAFLISGLGSQNIPPENPSRVAIDELKKRQQDLNLSGNRKGPQPDDQGRYDAIVMADYQQVQQDAQKLAKLADELKLELAKNDPRVLSLASLKRTEEIEKLAHRVRGRLRRWF